jgi:hypothetical protein
MSSEERNWTPWEGNGRDNGQPNAMRYWEWSKWMGTAYCRGEELFPFIIRLYQQII